MLKSFDKQLHLHEGPFSFILLLLTHKTGEIATIANIIFKKLGKK